MTYSRISAKAFSVKLASFLCVLSKFKSLLNKINFFNNDKRYSSESYLRSFFSEKISKDISKR